MPSSMRPRPSAGLTPYTWSSLGVPRRNPMTRRPLVRLSSRVSSSAARTGLFSGIRGPSMAILIVLQRSATEAAITAGVPVAIRPE